MVAIHKLVALSLVCVASVSCRHHAHADQPAELAAEAPASADAPLDADVERRRHRRKRWYSGYGAGLPSVYRDDSAPPPGPPFDPFAYIYRRLDELAALVRQSSAPQPLPPAPIFVPYPIYLPQGACGCPTAPGAPVAPLPTDANGTLPTFPNRVKPTEDDYDDEPIRPISFTPVRPDRPLSRPVPAVDHGSTQAGAGQQQGREPGALGQAAPPPAASTPQPSRCDLATLTCCHQRYTTDQCFNALGCPAALRGGDPCDSRTLANIVSVFQKFYAQS